MTVTCSNVHLTPEDQLDAIRRVYVRGMKNSRRHIIPQSTIPPVDLGQSRASKLVAELQQRGPETLSGLAGRKLRLTFAS